ncbi:glycosyltransferase family 2 protein [Ulvibacter antarcticus]|uniref:GT2 family glycosyltransferase n=1 Tax=Ulvibacter antarcticus TaxID=442714 RepID=A0A3L9YFS5_9FLAO|nr:glycosyltransferase family A protein [Ulvibacter antarcticus]RMA57989.1 GT2 family glycosyltransferase [Ulvibacter antarcticus]
MKLLIHHTDTPLRLLDESGETIPFSSEGRLSADLFALARTFPDELILWCNTELYEFLNLAAIDSIFHHKRIMASYAASKTSFLPKQIGYVEDSPFLKVNFEVNYPTWLMHSDVGGIHAEVLNLLDEKVFFNKSFDLTLNSIAKEAIKSGLFCYSNPKLLKMPSEEKFIPSTASNEQLFQFIKSHYKGVWIYLAFLSYLLYERKLLLFPLIANLFRSRKNTSTGKIQANDIISTSQKTIGKSMDVIIPTMGRKTYLYDVLKDLAKQTILPAKVIIVEQNADSKSKSELDYITSETWPFEIIHEFTHQAGACNARNIAIKKCTSDWIFMADDDIRFPENTLADVFRFLEQTQIKAVTLSCLRDDDIEIEKNVIQWVSFGSGCSVVSSEVVRATFYNMAYEFGYGEDMEYGMQLRNQGVDILYNPHIKLKHLKAAVGGFRKPIKKPWEAEVVLPKPAPTIMRFRMEHTTAEQLKGYKLQLFLKYYRRQKIKNPFAYIKMMKKAWNASQQWAKSLNNK